MAYFLSNALRLSMFIGFFKKVEIHLLEKDVMEFPIWGTSLGHLSIDMNFI